MFDLTVKMMSVHIHLLMVESFSVLTLHHNSAAVAVCMSRLSSTQAPSSSAKLRLSPSNNWKTAEGCKAQL